MSIKTLFHFPALLLAAFAAALTFLGFLDLLATLHGEFIVGHRVSFLAGSTPIFMFVIFKAWASTTQAR